MARQVFSTEAILDAAREVVVTRGARGATVEAISKEAGVPVGSIYHRFDSLAELLARTWLRAARRSQERALAVPSSPEGPLESAVAVARAMYDHCLEQPEDTLLLDALTRAELLSMDLGALRGEMEGVNERIETLMAGLARDHLRPRRPPHARPRAAGARGHAPRLRAPTARLGDAHAGTARAAARGGARGARGRRRGDGWRFASPSARRRETPKHPNPSIGSPP